MEYDNTNSGMLARNDNKKSDSHPDYSGFINVDGTEYWLSGWVKEGRAGSKMEGRKFFSLAIKPKQPREDAPKKALNDPLDDDIPF